MLHKLVQNFGAYYSHETEMSILDLTKKRLLCTAL
jgi:hypothetical protein